MTYKTLLLVGLLALTACLGNSRPTRYYFLSTADDINTSPHKHTKESTVILVGPVDLAKYLDRTNIVYRGESNELIVSDFDVWAEELDTAIARSIAHNLTHYLSSKSLTISSWQNLTSADVEIPLAIERFDCDGSGQCFLRILWTIKQKHNELLPLNVHAFSKRADSTSIQNQTNTLSQLLDEASRVLAEQLCQSYNLNCKSLGAPACPKA